MKRISILLCAFAFGLAGCDTANIIMERANTERGLINSNNARLGFLFIWDRESESVRRIDIIEPNASNIFRDEIGFDTEVSVESGAKFQGNVNLTAAEIKALEIEVSRRASFVSENLQTTAIRNPVRALTRAMNGSEDLVAAMEVKDVISSNGSLLYVIASEVGASEKTTLEIDNSNAAGSEFDVGKVKANLKFKITDIGKVEIAGRDGNLAPTFLRYSILQPRWTNNNTAGFRTVTEANIEELLDLVQQGKF